jgi:hypothetical protein
MVSFGHAIRGRPGSGYGPITSPWEAAIRREEVPEPRDPERHALDGKRPSTQEAVTRKKS